MVISGEKVRDSSALSFFTVTLVPSMFTSTPAGTVMGILPIRDITDTFLSYQMKATTSPPTPSLRASRSVMTPLDVEMMAVPKPPMTRGSSSLPA